MVVNSYSCSRKPRALPWAILGCPFRAKKETRDSTSNRPWPFFVRTRLVGSSRRRGDGPRRLASSRGGRLGLLAGSDAVAEQVRHDIVEGIDRVESHVGLDLGGKRSEERRVGKAGG